MTSRRDDVKPPDFLAIGHAAQDMNEDGSWQLGGPISYAATLARNLGLRTAVLTSASAEVDFGRLLPGVEVKVVPSETSTRFHNTYDDGRRTQRVSGRAAPLTLADLPDEWRAAPVVLLGPLVGEIDDELARAFPDAVAGIGAQGWLREIGAEGVVRPVAPEKWDAGAVLERATALFVSEEDIPPETVDAAIARWLESVGIVAFTRGDRGADVYVDGEVRRIGAFPSRPVELTGAGDIFASAFLVRLHETGDPWEATRFAACAASFVVEGVALAGVPTRQQIEGRLGENPGITALIVGD